jgi:hypothetical protein
MGQTRLGESAALATFAQTGSQGQLHLNEPSLALSQVHKVTRIPEAPSCLFKPLPHISLHRCLSPTIRK